MSGPKTTAMPGARRPLLIALLACVVPTLLVGQGLTPEQVVRLEAVTSVALSPDGQQIAFTLRKPRGEDEAYGGAYTELWIVTSRGENPRPVVEAPLSASQPQWSPDGATLGFVARLPDRDEQSQVYGVPGSGGALRKLSNSPIGVMAFEWSPTGDALAYTAREPIPADVVTRRERGDDAWVAGEGHRHVRLWIERLGRGDPEAVTPRDRTVWAFAWAPDGQRLAVQTTTSPEIDHSYMFRALQTVSAAGGPPRTITETPGKLGDMAWSPDGRMLAFIGAVSQNDPLAQSLFVVPAEGGAATNLTDGYEGSVTALAWRDNGSVTFLADEGTRTTLNAVSTEPGDIRRLAGGAAEVVGSVSFDAGHRTVAAVASTAQHPEEVFVGQVGRGSLQRITHHNAWLGEVALARQETIEWSHADGTRVEGVLIHPLREQPGVRYPLAILPHGGPEGVSRDGWTTSALYPAQVLAANGYAVLMPNYRGSGGRGVGFAKADHRDLGGKEFEDVIAGIDHLVSTGLVDVERVGSSGTSYGGYFSAWAGARHADRFKAAITFAGITNWVSFTGTTDIPYEMSIVHWDFWWFDNPGVAWDRSPVAHVDENAAPTLVAHGAVDERVHPEQSYEFHRALEFHGVPTGLVVYPREPHGLRERAHQLDFMRRVLEWLDRHVKSAPPATG